MSTKLFKAISFACLTFFLHIFTSTAYSASYPILIDAEVDHVLQKITAPILGLTKIDKINFILIQDATFNAFVLDSKHIFLHTGALILDLKPGGLLSALAHEIAHIEHSHLVKKQDTQELLNLIKIASTSSLVALSILTNNFELMPTSALIAEDLTNRLIKKYTREQELIADFTALQYLDKLKYKNTSAVYLHRLQSLQESAEQRYSKYLATHPLNSERITNIMSYNPLNKETVDIPYTEEFARIVIKCTALIDSPASILQRFHDDSSTNGLYALAIAYYKKQEIQKAMELVEVLLSREPENPYFHEMKGALLFHEGRVQEAKEAYKTALQIDHESLILKKEYISLLENAQDNEAAILELKKLMYMPNNEIWTLEAISRIYLKTQQYDLASVYLLKKALILQTRDLKSIFTLTKKYVKKGSYADDILQDLISHMSSQ